eukprot:9620627-Prorocentrum_lima.AAC.1
MTSSLVGSEMCIRDRCNISPTFVIQTTDILALLPEVKLKEVKVVRDMGCLLYTSDAADDM